MIPLLKVVSLLFRVFSKPLINYTKTYHATNGIKSNKMRVFFIMLGNKYHYFETYINKRYLKVANSFAYKPLNDNLALQKGIQFFYELIFYTIIIGFPISQLYVASEQSKQKSTQLNGRIKSIEQKSNEIRQKIQQLVELKRVNQSLESNYYGRYNWENLGQIISLQGNSQNVQRQLANNLPTIKLQYGNKIIKEFKFPQLK